MQNIIDLKIIGIDEMRPPIIRKEPYIDIFFKLSEQAPKEWCKDFNVLLSKEIYKATIEEKQGLYINTWVRTPAEIPELLEKLKIAVKECTNQYIERLTIASQQSQSNENQLIDDTSKQGQLNRIVASLNFVDDINQSASS